VKIAKVIVDVQASPINQTFDYIIPDAYEPIIEKGMRVIIPFGPRKITGFVVDLDNDSTFPKHKLKPLLDVIDITPVLTPELLDLGKWLAQQTLCLYITAFQAMLPHVLKAKYEKHIVRLTEDRLLPDLETLFSGYETVNFERIKTLNISYHHVRQAIQSGDIMVKYVVTSRETKKYETYIQPAIDPHRLEEALVDLPKNAKRQSQLLHFFIENPDAISQNKLLRTLNMNRANVKALIDKGLLTEEKREVFRNPYDDQQFRRTTARQLTTEQQQAIIPIQNAIKAEQHGVFLVHGVTGSGKTEIYLQAIQDVVNKNQEAIVLVPEISLTPQMVTQFKSRFGSNVAVLHSALSAGEKFDEWRRIHRKEVQVVVGARSAIFAPFENLGIMIIDEEHETTYKQEDQPRYHARDVAIKRGKTHHCPVVLGSATPTLESYARAQKGVYKLATLNKRTNERAMPKVEVVDMREELHAGNRTMFSRELQAAITERIQRKEQIVLLLNRRGYSTFVMCRDCGHVKECPHCDIALTYHKKTNQLKCHYCSKEEPMPDICPECRSDLIRYFGTGTQRIEEALSDVIPEARVIRMDVDTTRRKGAHEKLLKQFSDQEADILLGTQMIAKGLDFPNVTLVGVLTADSMLHLPDFRASEKTFQLLTQVSGRAGRHDLPGKVIVQTYTPEHYSIDLASLYDFRQFYRREMRIRKTFQYPPYVFLVLITVSHVNHVKVIQTTQKIVQLLIKNVQQETVVLGPTPSPLSRIKDRYRYQCMIKYKDEPKLRQLIQKIINQFSEEIRKENLQIAVDMQPYQLM